METNSDSLSVDFPALTTLNQFQALENLMKNAVERQEKDEIGANSSPYPSSKQQPQSNGAQDVQHQNQSNKICETANSTNRTVTSIIDSSFRNREFVNSKEKFLPVLGSQSLT